MESTLSTADLGGSDRSVMPARAILDATASGTRDLRAPEPLAVQRYSKVSGGLLCPT